MTRIDDINAAHVLAARINADRIIVDCGHYALPEYVLVPDWQKYADSPGQGVTGWNGFGTFDGFRRCKACSERFEKERMAQSDRITGYLSADNRHVTTWTGGTLARVTSHHTSKAARKTYVQAVDSSGARWYGSGPAESGTYVTLRRAKGTRA